MPRNTQSHTRSHSHSRWGGENGLVHKPALVPRAQHARFALQLQQCTFNRHPARHNVLPVTSAAAHSTTNCINEHGNVADQTPTPRCPRRERSTHPVFESVGNTGGAENAGNHTVAGRVTDQCRQNRRRHPAGPRRGRHSREQEGKGNGGSGRCEGGAYPTWRGQPEKMASDPSHATVWQCCATVCEGSQVSHSANDLLRVASPHTSGGAWLRLPGVGSRRRARGPRCCTQCFNGDDMPRRRGDSDAVLRARQC